MKLGNIAEEYIYMYKAIKNKLSGKALFLLGVYVLHFIFFQHIAAHLSDSYSPVKTFFSASRKSRKPDSGIGTFRVLEKHEISKVFFILHTNLTEAVSPIADYTLSNNDESAHPIPEPQEFHLSETSYKLYVRDCVFRI